MELHTTKRKWRWHDDFPQHLRSFAALMSDLDELQAAHLQFLIAEGRKGKDGGGQNSSEDHEQHIIERDTVYFRSAVLLLCAVWEAFVEDLLRNAVTFLIENVIDTGKLPLSIRKIAAQDVKNDKHELSPWFLAGDHWKAHLTKLCDQRIQAFNTPKSEQIRSMYFDFLGINIIDAWEWDYSSEDTGSLKFDKENTVEFIDRFVSLRGAIAHGRRPSEMPGMFFLANVAVRMHQVATLMHNTVSTALAEATNTPCWRLINFNLDWRPYLTTDEVENSKTKLSAPS